MTEGRHGLSTDPEGQTMTSITDAGEDDRRIEQRRSSDLSSPAKTFGVALAVISLAGSVFTAGYNWRSVAILEANQDQFVRKDVQAEQLQRVNDRLSEISRQLEELRGELRTNRRKEQP